MSAHAISAELLKLRHSKILLPCICLPFLGLFIGAANFTMNRTALHMPEWQALWTQAALFYGYFFYPILMALCAAYLWRIEHRDHNWNPLMTAPVPVRVIFLSKLIVLVFIGFMVQCFLMAIYWCAGTFFFHFTDPFPLGLALQWLLCGWLAAICVSAMQLFLSMRIRSFAVPIGISLGCCIVGLAFYALGAGKIFPNSLLMLGVGATSAIGIPMDTALSIILMGGLYTALFIILAIGYLKKQDIAAG